MEGPLSITPCSISGSFQASQSEKGCPEPPKISHSFHAGLQLSDPWGSSVLLQTLLSSYSKAAFLCSD